VLISFIAVFGIIGGFLFHFSILRRLIHDLVTISSFIIIVYLSQQIADMQHNRIELMIYPGLFFWILFSRLNAWA
jgi:hypothetical protein